MVTGVSESNRMEPIQLALNGQAPLLGVRVAIARIVGGREILAPDRRLATARLSGSGLRPNDRVTASQCIELVAVGGIVRRMDACQRIENRAHHTRGVNAVAHA